MSKCRLKCDCLLSSQVLNNVVLLDQTQDNLLLFICYHCRRENVIQQPIDWAQKETESNRILFHSSRMIQKEIRFLKFKILKKITCQSYY